MLENSYFYEIQNTLSSFSCNTATGCIECNNSLISSPCIRNKMKEKETKTIKVFPEFTPKYMESFL